MKARGPRRRGPASIEEPNTLKRMLKAGGRLTIATFGAGVGALLAAVRFLAGAADTTPAADELSSSVRGGLLNYRTGKFDDGVGRLLTAVISLGIPDATRLEEALAARTQSGP